MGELTKQTKTTTTTTKWYSSLLTPQTFLMALTGLVAATIFWSKTEDNWKKTETKADKDDVKMLEERIKDLEDRVTRQYSVNRETNDKNEKDIEQALDWQHQWDGYWKGVHEKAP